MSRGRSSAHVAFEIGIFLKGLNGALELAGGLLLYLVPASAITDALQKLTQHEVSEDRNDFIASHLLRLSEEFSVSSQHFAAAYLLIHGIVKVALVWALYRRTLWAYPAAIAIFATFGAYQIYRYVLSPSFAMIALTVLDAIVIVLTWMEYRRLRTEELPGSA